jgi:hypothetical protein
VLSPQMRDAVRGVAEHFPTAIVSGRCRDKVHSDPQPSRSCLALRALGVPVPAPVCCKNSPPFSVALRT